MTTAVKAIRRVLGSLETRLGLIEHHGAGRGPWLSIAGTGATRGQLHCYSGAGLDKAVFLTLEDGEQLDAAMLMVFSDPASPVPHLVLDAAPVGRDFAIFVDLVPRVDLAVNAEYLKAAYNELLPVFDDLSHHSQLRVAHVPHTLRPFVSPWMAGFRATGAQLSQLFELVGPYISHWIALHQGVVSLPRPQDVAAHKQRDLVHRASLFSKEADPVWDVLSAVVGAENARRVVELLRTHGVPLAYSLRPPPAKVE